jgi:hypothetical protein
LSALRFAAPGCGAARPRPSPETSPRRRRRPGGAVLPEAMMETRRRRRCPRGVDPLGAPSLRSSASAPGGCAMVRPYPVPTARGMRPRLEHRKPGTGTALAVSLLSLCALSPGARQGALLLPRSKASGGASLG